MRTFRLFTIISLLLLNSCSLFKKGAEIYPSGVIFPLEIKNTILYRGKLIGKFQKIGNYVYFSTQEGLVYSVHLAYGIVMWETRVSGPLMGPPYIAGENLYVVSEDATVTCLSLEGEISWEQRLPGGNATGVAEMDGEIFICNNRGVFFVLDARNGRMLRQWTVAPPPSSNLLSHDKGFVYGDRDGDIHVVDLKGNLRFSITVGGGIGRNLFIEGNKLFVFPEETREAVCIDLKKKQRKWRLKLGSKVKSLPAVYKNNLLVMSWSGILFCLNKNNGTQRWWRRIPSRSHYDVEVVQGRVIATSFSTALVSYDIKTGEQVGYYEIPYEVRSNPVWFDSTILVGAYDDQKSQGELIYLKKAVGVDLTPSKTSPASVNEEVILSAKAFGFFEPEYEFFIKKKSGREILQPRSKKDQFPWYPSAKGSYNLGVTTYDNREKAETLIPFKVEEKIYTETEKAEFYLEWPSIRGMLLRIPWGVVYPTRKLWSDEEKSYLTEKLRSIRDMLFRIPWNIIYPTTEGNNGQR
ncbi:PQQ-binding-like beta-propeller repeat protein [Acidobacteriota bacterium]